MGAEKYVPDIGAFGCGGISARFLSSAGCRALQNGMSPTLSVSRTVVRLRDFAVLPFADISSMGLASAPGALFIGFAGDISWSRSGFGGFPICWTIGRVAIEMPYQFPRLGADDADLATAERRHSSALLKSERIHLERLTLG